MESLPQIIPKTQNELKFNASNCIYLLKPFQLNVLKQNAKNVRTDHFKRKTLQIIKAIKLQLNCQLKLHNQKYGRKRSCRRYRRTLEKITIKNNKQTVFLCL